MHKEEQFENIYIKIIILILNIFMWAGCYYPHINESIVLYSFIIPISFINFISINLYFYKNIKLNEFLIFLVNCGIQAIGIASYSFVQLYFYNAVTWFVGYVICIFGYGVFNCSMFVAEQAYKKCRYNEYVVITDDNYLNDV